MSGRPRNSSKVATAYHEAGHAVAACVLGVRFLRVTIRAVDGSDGHVHFLPDYRRLKRYENESVRIETVLRDMCVSIAGNEAQRRVTGRNDRSGQGVSRYKVGERTFSTSTAGSDMSRINFLLEYVCQAPDEYRLFYAWANQRTKQLLTHQWEWVENVAAALLEKETLTEAEIKELNPIAIRFPWPDK